MPVNKYGGLSTDTTLGGASPSDEVVSSQKALKIYIDNHSGGGGVKTNNLFDNKWFDYLLNDQNWLRADTFSWQDGTVYTEAYNHLVDDVQGKEYISETIEGHTIWYRLADDGHKIVTQASDYDGSANVNYIYEATGVAWYYVLDETNQRFKLPRENPIREELLQLIRVKGDGKVLGLTDGTDNLGITRCNLNGVMYASGYNDLYGADVGTIATGGTIQSAKGLGVTTDSTKSGIIANMTDSTSVFKGKKYLYFYVGEFSQTATEQTAGLNSELFNGKVDLDGHNATFAHIVETYSNGTAWYRIWSDGWCEQGNVTNLTQNPQTISLIKPFLNTNYTLTACNGDPDDNSNVVSAALRSKTTTDFKVVSGYYGTFYATTLDWVACGYVS